MTHPSEQDLILHYYGELQSADIVAHIQTCSDCQQALEALTRDLENLSVLDVPPLPEDYGMRVWSKLEPQIGEIAAENPKISKLPLLWIPAIAAIIVVALLVGQKESKAPFTLHPQPQPQANQVLNGRIANHLEASAKVLAQMNSAGAVSSNSPQEDTPLRWLLRDNRLYRQALPKDQNGKSKEVLEDLEFLLLRLNHANAGPELPPDLAEDVVRLLPKLREVMDQIERPPEIPNHLPSQF